MFPVILVCVIQVLSAEIKPELDDPPVDIYDLTSPTSWHELSAYYTAVQRQWKVCMSCGVASLGTSMHLELSSDITGSVHPAVIPVDYLMTRLIIIDVTLMHSLSPAMVLTVDVALQWNVMKEDPVEPTLLVFKFGWTMNSEYNRVHCVCKVPGISYELAQWIATNMSHVVGVGTDAPTLESEETRDFTMRTVSNALGKNGIYIIENINLKRNIPERGCLVLSTPLKLMNLAVVPAGLTALCPRKQTFNKKVILKTVDKDKHQHPAKRVYDVNLKEILE